jgi:hypothetical protein
MLLTQGASFGFANRLHGSGISKLRQDNDAWIKTETRTWQVWLSHQLNSR